MVIGVVLLIVGIGAVAASTAVQRGRAKVVGGNVPVNPGGTDRLEVAGQNSPEVEANPTDRANIVVVSRVDSPRFSCSMHVSFDGGASWAPTPMPMPDGKSVACFAPDLAFEPDGTLRIAFSSFADVKGSGNVPDAVWLTTSVDGGRTLSAPTAVLGPRAFSVRLVADPGRGRRLYLTWVQASATTSWGFVDGRNPIMLARSDDGGATWTTPEPVSPDGRHRTIGPALVVGARGSLHLAYIDVGDDRLDYLGAHDGRGGEPYPGRWSLVVATSEDGGSSWHESVLSPDLSPTQRFLMLFPPSPSLVADRSGRVWAAFQDGRLGDADVWLWRSGDSGRRWRSATRVNDTHRGDGTSQSTAQVDIAPDGRLDVMYYDRRADSHDVLTEVSLQTSFDGGRSFTPRVVLSDVAFDSRVGYGADRGLPELGGRLGLLSANRAALAVWADTRTAEVAATGEQNLARAVVTFRRPSRAGTPLEVGGIGSAIVGVVTAGVSIVTGRRSRRRVPV